MAGCSNIDPASPSSGSDDGHSSSASLQLHSQMNHDSDVEEIEFNIRPCNGSSVVASETKSMAEMTLPGGIAKWEDEPFDENSEHLFADAFFVLDAGCYDVETIPRDNQSGQPDDGDDLSEDCEPAHRDDVQVEDGITTEILLINQCEGDARGGLDVISSLNHPPEISNLEFETSKFLTSCATNRVCVRASAPDGDPLEFEWETVSTPGSGSNVNAIAKISERQLPGNHWESCARIVPDQSGTSRLRVEVFDLDGNGNRMEKILAEQEPASTPQSRDTLEFPAHSQLQCPYAAEDIDGDGDNEDLVPRCDIPLGEGFARDIDGDDNTDVAFPGLQCEGGRPLEDLVAYDSPRELPTELQSTFTEALCPFPYFLRSNPIQVDLDRDGFEETLFLGGKDTDNDGTKDFCDPDDDGDGVPDDSDNCIKTRNPNQKDEDPIGSPGNSDGIGDACDNCPDTLNRWQFDGNGDGFGDICALDVDGDGVNGNGIRLPSDPDPDDDADGIDDGMDNCVIQPNPNQTDTDGDGRGDACDLNSDGDRFNDDNDPCPVITAPQSVPCDDDDGDGVKNSDDNCQQKANPGQIDSDGDGLGDKCDCADF